jgi:hypothetical protein
VEAIVAGQQLERQLAALRAALAMHPVTRSLLHGRALPEHQVRRSQGLEQRQQLGRVLRATGVQMVDPQVLVIGQEVRSVMRQDPAERPPTTSSASTICATHSKTDDSFGSGRVRTSAPAAAISRLISAGVPSWTFAGSSPPSSPSSCCW